MFLSIVLGGILNCISPATEAQAQIPLHDKRLKTKKQEKKSTRKKLFEKRKGEDSKKVNPEVRTLEPAGSKKDNRSLSRPSYEGGGHRLDTDRKEYDRPVSPETNFGGRSKRKKNKAARKDKAAASYTGDQKKSATVLKPQRGSAASGGIKAKSEKQVQNDFKGSSEGMHQYSGRTKTNNKGNSDKDATQHEGKLKIGSDYNKPLRESSYSKNLSKRKSEKRVKKELERDSQSMHQFSGRNKSTSPKLKRNRNASQHEGNLSIGADFNKPLRESSYSKNLIKRKSEKQLKRDLERESQNMHQFSGGLRFKKVRKDADRDKKATLYTGNLKYGSNIMKPQRGSAYTKKTVKGKSEKKINKEFEQHSKEMHQYAGSRKIKVSDRKILGNEFGRTLKVPAVTARTKHFEKLSKKAHQYAGDIRIKKSKHKDQHPSISYLDGKKKSSIEKKEKLRKRKISWFKFWKNSDQPKSVKEKPSKPKYDSRESEIWYD